MKNLLLKNLLATVVATSAFSAASPSFAQDNFYVGAGVSQTFVDEIGLDEDDTGGKVYAGYRFNDYLAVEGAYYDFGEIEDAGNQLEVDGLSVAVIGSLPVTEKLSIFGKVGAHDWDAQARGAFSTQLSSDGDTDAFYGVGVDYALSDNISLRAEVERYEVEELDIDTASFGISFNF